MPVGLIDDVQLAAQRLAHGDLVAFPTETVYGLGADARNPRALARIYAAKQRPDNHPLIVHVASAGALAQWALRVPEMAHRLAAAFWPGPLTLVLPRAAHVLDAVTGGQDTVALRCPAHPLAQSLLKEFATLKNAAGLAAPSANLFGHVSPTTAAHVLGEFAQSDEQVWVLDGETAQLDVGIESTIVDVSRVDTALGKPVLLRPGQISAVQLESVLGCAVAVPDASSGDPSTPRVSGSLKAHYAPRTPLYMVEAQELPALLTSIAAKAGKTALWHFGLPDLPALPNVDGYLAPTQAASYARMLYAQLRAFDAAGYYAHIVVQKPPPTPEWAGVLDRLTRAAAAFS